jgi:sugar phosphate isomerase/epimerase
MSANFVARQTGYHMTEGWAQGDTATNEYFRPLETFAARFDALLAEVRAMGFDAVDIWTAHLNWRWATPEHLAIARASLDRHELVVSTVAGNFGSTAEELAAACRLAVALDTRLLGGSTSSIQSDRAAAVATLQRHGCRLAIENHPGLLTAEEMLAVVQDGAAGVIGTTVDTGWYGTAAVDAVRAIQGLGHHILHVHLKDVLAPGSHVTCGYGRGCVPIEACVRTLQGLGYSGGISVEHEPEDHDPTAECRESFAMLRSWLRT